MLDRMGRNLRKFAVAAASTLGVVLLILAAMSWRTPMGIGYRVTNDLALDEPAPGPPSAFKFIPMDTYSGHLYPGVVDRSGRVGLHQGGLSFAYLFVGENPPSGAASQQFAGATVVRISPIWSQPRTSVRSTFDYDFPTGGGARSAIGRALESLGFQWFANRESGFCQSFERSGFRVQAPCGLVVLLLFTPGLMALRRRLRVRSRHDANQCKACGYDLRGSPASDVCPECGLRAVPGAAQTTTGLPAAQARGSVEA